MHLVYEQIKREVPRLNRSPITWDDIERLCKKNCCGLKLLPLQSHVKGYYSCEKRNIYYKKSMVINSKLPQFEQLFTAAHESVHAVTCHAKSMFRQPFFCRIDDLNDARHDVEANALALVMVIPKRLLFELAETPVDDLAPYTQQMLFDRKKVFDDFGI